MKTFNKNIVTLMSLICLAAVVSGCENNDIRDWQLQVKRLRVLAEEQIDATPYRRDQHIAFKSYFVSLSTMAESLRQDTEKRRRFNEAVRSSDVGVLCQEIFMPEAQWRRLMQSCIKNRFFLCAEEVRAYPALRNALRSSLSATTARLFDGAEQCRMTQLAE